MIIRSLFIAFLTVISVNFSKCQCTYQVSWTSYFDLDYNSSSNAIFPPKLVIDSLGGLYFTGFAGFIKEDVFCYKLDTNEGEILWQYSYGIGPTTITELKGAEATQDSNILLISSGFDPIFNLEATRLIKLSPNRDTIWSQVYAYEDSFPTIALSNKHVLDEKGNLFLFTSHTLPSGNSQWGVSKITPDGEVLWETSIEIIIGLHLSLRDTHIKALGSPYLYSIDRETGEIVDSTVVNLPSEFNNAKVHSGMEGEFYFGKFARGYQALKMDQNGTILWIYDKAPSAPLEQSIDRLWYIEVDQEQSAYCAGVYQDSDLGLGVLLTKLDALGEPIWEKRYDQFDIDATDWVQNLYLIGDRIFIVGYSVDLEGRRNRLILMYDRDGNLICDLSQVGSLAEEESIISLVVDDNGNIYVAGYTEDERLFVQKYSLLTSTSKSYSDEPQWLVYPNPLHDEMIVETHSNFRTARFKLSNGLGQAVLSLETTDPVVTLSCSHLPPDVYVLQIITDQNAIATFKLVKQ